MLEPRIGEFTASDGYRHCYRQWPAAGDPRGRIVALHGIQSHSGWYEYSCRRLAMAGWEVWFLDRRGSGMNNRERGHAPNGGRLLEDVREFAEMARRTEPEVLPMVLMAVSWGGKLAAVTAARAAGLVDAVALLYPGILARIKPRWSQRLALRLAERMGSGQRLRPIPLRDPGMFTSSRAWQEFIRRDPLALHEVTVSFLNASLQLDELAVAAPPAITCPLLLMLAGADRIIDNAATEGWLTRVRGPVRSVVYPQAEHTLEFEACREQFVSDLLVWLESATSAGGKQTPPVTA